MTILFQTNIRNTMIGRGILPGLAIPPGGVGVTIYSGVQPTAATIAANWSTYNSGNASFLIHFFNVGWTQPLSGLATFASITTFPVLTAASNTSPGAWCIIWATNVTAPNLGSGPLPNTSFLVGPVTDTVGNGVVRFNPNTNFVAASSYNITDGNINATST